MQDVQHVADFPDFTRATFKEVDLPPAKPGQLVLSVETFALSVRHWQCHTTPLHTLLKP